MTYRYFEISYPKQQHLTHRELFLDGKTAIQNDSSVIGWVEGEDIANRICTLLNKDSKSRENAMIIMESRLLQITETEAENNRLKQKVSDMSKILKELKEENDSLKTTHEEVFIIW